MKCLVIYSHPNEKSFNFAVKEEVVKQLQENKHEVEVRDLYAINFNPALSLKDFSILGEGNIPKDIEIEQNFITWADAIIVIHPTWWNSFPAMLKGYIDKVLLPGFAYKYGDSGVVPLLTGKKGLIFRTLGGDEKLNLEDGRKKAYETTSNYGTLGFCGINILNIENFWSAPFVDDAKRKEYLSKIKEVIKKL